jgi:hypothetical protein
VCKLLLKHRFQRAEAAFICVDLIVKISRVKLTIHVSTAERAFKFTVTSMGISATVTRASMESIVTVKSPFVYSTDVE